MTERQKEIFDSLTELRKKFTVTDSWLAEQNGISKQTFHNQLYKNDEMDTDVYNTTKELIKKYPETHSSVVTLHFTRRNTAKDSAVEYKKQSEKLSIELERTNLLLDGMARTQQLLADQIESLKNELKKKDTIIKDLHEKLGE